MKFYNNRLYDRRMNSKRVKDHDPDDNCWPEFIEYCLGEFEDAINAVEKASLKHSIDFKTNPGHQMLSDEEWEAIYDIDYYTSLRITSNATFVETVKAYPELGKKYINLLKKLQSKHWDWIEDGYDYPPIDYERLISRTYDIAHGRSSRTCEVKDEYVRIGYNDFRWMLEGICDLLEPYVGVNPITVTGLDRSEDAKKYTRIMGDLEDASSQVQYLFNDLDTIDSTERLVSDLLEAEPEGVKKLTKLKLDHLRVRDDGENGYEDENEYEDGEDKDEDEDKDDDKDDDKYYAIGRKGRTVYEQYTRNAYKRATAPTFHPSNPSAKCVDLIMNLRGMLIALIKAWNKDSDTWQIGNRNYYKYVAADMADDVNNTLSYMKRKLDEFIRIFKDAAKLYTPSQVPEGFARTARGNATKYKKEAGGGFDPALYQVQGMENFGHDDDHTPSNDPLVPETDTPEGYAERNEQEKASLQDGMKQVNEVMSAGNPKKAYEVLAADKAEENSIGVEEFLKKYPWDKFYEYISDTTAYRYTKEQFEFDKQNPPDSYDEGAFGSDRAAAFSRIDNDSSYSSELQTWLENAPDIRSFVFWFYNEFGKTPLASAGDDADFRAAAKRYKVNYAHSSRTYNFASFLTDWIFAYGIDKNLDPSGGDYDEALDEAIEHLLQEAQAACDYINGATSGN